MDLYGFRARGQAMGGAMTAVADDHTATFYNPGMLGFLKRSTSRQSAIVCLLSPSVGRPVQERATSPVLNRNKRVDSVLEAQRVWVATLLSDSRFIIRSAISPVERPSPLNGPNFIAIRIFRKNSPVSPRWRSNPSNG